jgi:hypothetical protein
VVADVRPVPIPDDQVWDGAVRRVIVGPSGDPTDDDIRPVEALVYANGMGSLAFAMRIELEPGDLEQLARDPHFWLVQHGVALQPFALAMPDVDEPPGSV